jgi:hypothetical protein
VANFLRSLNISSTSFWLGFLCGILFTYVLSRLVIYIPRVVRAIKKNMTGIRQSFSTSVDVRLRNDVYRFAQKQHLTASLFSLDEIAIVPKVLTPLIQAPGAAELAPTDCVSLSVPYIPDWPELAAVYRASTMNLIDALQGGANLILAGHPGSGKTVALAWLASSIARNAPGLGILEGMLPLYVHATDLQYLLSHADDIIVEEPSSKTRKISKAGPRNKKIQAVSGSVDILINAVSSYASSLTVPRLPGAVRTAFEKQRVILILDRTDELPPNQAAAITDYLRSLLEIYPKLRIVTAMSYEYLAGLPAMGFRLLGMAAWGDEDRDAFLLRWSDLWDKWIYKLEKDHSKKINVRYLNSWLKTNNELLKPLEYTLKVWSAYSGDIIGTDGPSSIEAYIRRMTVNVSKSRPALERFALHTITSLNIIANPHDADRAFSHREPDEFSLSSDTSGSTPDTPATSAQAKPAHIKALSGIDILTDNGFLTNYPGSHYGFIHPVVCGYLAGNGLAHSGSIGQIQKQPAWIGKSLAMYYFARNGDVTSMINELVQEDDILHSNHLTIARWLQIAPKNRQWRSSILRTLTTILHKEKDTISLAGKIASGLAFSGDSGVSVLFRQLLKSDNPNLKQLAALGCGILGEKKAVEELNNLLQEDSPASIRAASLALAAIGDKPSLEILASNLLNGSELARRYSAEALANNPVEGHPALKEGSKMEDLLVRRSVAFGLIRVNQPWAIKIVENLQLEDNEWVVRNSALQAFDEFRRRISYAPKPLADPTEMEWLINFAAKVGTTVAPGKPADDLVVKALTSGNKDEILFALDYLRIKCDENTISEINTIYNNNTEEIKDVAYYVLWLMMIAGINVPLAIKYNIK